MTTKTPGVMGAAGEIAHCGDATGPLGSSPLGRSRRLRRGSGSMADGERRSPTARRLQEPTPPGKPGVAPRLPAGRRRLRPEHDLHACLAERRPWLVPSSVILVVAFSPPESPGDFGGKASPERPQPREESIMPRSSVSSPPAGATAVARTVTGVLVAGPVVAVAIAVPVLWGRALH